MKKISTMTGIEKIAYRNIKHAFNNTVGEWYNCTLDGCEEYIPDTIEQAKQAVYETALADRHDTGYIGYDKAPKEMRFAGKDFIMECIDHLFKKDPDGDIAEITDVKGW